MGTSVEPQGYVSSPYTMSDMYRPKVKSDLHRHVNRRRAQDDTKRAVMAHYERKSPKRPWRKVQQFVSSQSDKLGGITKCSRIVDHYFVAWPTRTHVLLELVRCIFSPSVVVLFCTRRRNQGGTAGALNQGITGHEEEQYETTT